MYTKTDKDKRLHMGVLFGTLDDMSQYVLFNGIVEYARQYDIHLTAYFGAYMAMYRDLASHYETCLESIRNSTTLDGLILFSGYITTDMKADVFSDYLNRLPKSLPLVSVSYLLKGIPSILVDNIAGMRTVTEHLIHSHNKRKIAFISGPKGHFEAEERLKGYQAALSANGIKYDERYVLQGDFTSKGGVNAVAELIDRKRLDFDAIVACNDAMASSAMTELISRGIRVHEDIAVTGFDDDILSIRATPALSTIRQNFFELGLTAAKVLSDVIMQKTVNPVYRLSPVFVPRRSCGCFEKELLRSDRELFSVSGERKPKNLAEYAEIKILPLFKDSVPKNSALRWISDMINALQEDPLEGGKFLVCLYNALTEYKKYSNDVSVWNDVLKMLRFCVSSFENEPAVTGRISDMRAFMSVMLAAITLVHDEQQMLWQTQDFDAKDIRAVISKVTSSLTVTFDTDSLAGEMAKSLPEIYLNTALVCLFNEAIKSDKPDADRALCKILGYDGDKRFNLDYNSGNKRPPYDYSRIEGFDFERRRRTLFFLPLFFEDIELGIALLSFDNRIPVETYDILRVDISAAVKGAQLLSKIQEMSTIDELTGLLNRRGFFQNAASSLQYFKRVIEPITPVVLYIDMDNLKSINDTYGHTDGDAAIAAFAKILKDAMRRVDVIGRIGGDEFVVLTSVKELTYISQLKERIHSMLRDYNAKKTHRFSLACSIGNAIPESLTMQSLEEAMIKADDILYEEKARKKRK